MANWCVNNLNIYGSETDLQKVVDLFTEMDKKQEEANKGQLPDWVDDSNGGYFFDIQLNDPVPSIGSIYIWYQTKHGPNVEIVVEIAKKFNVEFQYDYEESGNSVYGRGIYKNGILKEYDLTDEFDEYEYDDDNEVYRFRGEEYESDWEILETLLEEKIKKDDNTN